MFVLASERRPMLIISAYANTHFLQVSHQLCGARVITILFSTIMIINAVSLENLLVNFKNVFNSIQRGVRLCEYAGDDWPLAMCRTHSLAISLTFSSLAIIFFHWFGTFSFSVQKHFWMYLWNNFLRRFFMYCVTYNGCAETGPTCTEAVVCSRGARNTRPQRKFHIL